MLAIGRPHFLPVDDEVFTVQSRPRLQRCEIAARVRLAEQLAPDVLPGADARQVVGALRIAAEADESAGGERTGTDRRPDPRAGQLLTDDELLHGIRVGAT